VFNRVWNTPENGYGERFKHTIEPFLSVQRTSAIANGQRIIRTDGVDSVVGNASSYTYGVNNRLYAKRRVGAASQAQEILNVELRQTYYTDERAAAFDQQYTGYNLGASPFSPVLLTVRATPSASTNATFRAEIDSRHRELRTASASAGYNWTTRLQTTVGWSQRYFIAGLPGYDDPGARSHYINVDTRTRTADNRVGLNYSFNYDALNTRMLQQRVTAFYNAQCCGIAAEYQTYSAGGSSLAALSDRRFFLSFTLAGLGNFSPFSGAMGAIPR
jgi:hypothetical protein